MEYCEERNLNYIKAVKFYKPIKNEVFHQKGWISLHDGIEITEWFFRLPGWSHPRRMIAVRKNLSKRPRSSGKLLLWDGMEERYRYSVFVTNLDLPAQMVWKLYRDRADAENRIKELKYDFGADSFCLSSFFATEAAFRFIMVAYNLLSLFRQIVLRERKQSTLKTLRFKCFALGAWITKHSRQNILKIALVIESEDVEKLFSPKQLEIWNYLRKVEEATPLEICRETKIAKPTVIQALNRLIKLRKIERIGMGRGTRYRKL